MYIVCDSSGCCGIKHFRNVPDYPNHRVFCETSFGNDREEAKTSEPEDIFSMCLEITQEDLQQIPGYLSDRAEAHEYLKFLLQNLYAQRDAGMVTLNLVRAYLDDDDEDYEDPDLNGPGIKGWRDWQPYLKALGFIETNRFFNANSGNVVSHYTHVFDTGERPII